ncbi:ankyrin repeat-containing domain protein [Mycena sp. CBHHK59/15]|nr:ankyrin repeat-containing domain protein [Mycena sp. CBHHK59/15]
MGPTFLDFSPVFRPDAAQNGHQHILELLLQRDEVDANTHDFFSCTPLSYAAQQGGKAVVELLLQRDEVDPNTLDRYSRTPLSYAAQRGHQDIVELLPQREDVHPNTLDSYSRTPLSYAAENGLEDVVRLPLQWNEVDPNLQDTELRTPLAMRSNAYCSMSYAATPRPAEEVEQRAENSWHAFEDVNRRGEQRHLRETPRLVDNGVEDNS